jgi:DNA-binding Lrp family transcriptional regulator
MPENGDTEELHVSGEGLVARVKELVREGNVRRIKIKNEDGRTLLEIPLTLGVVGVALIPVWVALGAIAALAANYTLEIERGKSGPPAAR